MRSVKIAHITTVDSSLRYLLLNQMCSIRELGYEVTGVSAPGLESTVIEQHGIRHISVSMTRNFSPFKDLLSLLKLCTIIRNEHFTIVHTHTPKAGLLGQLAARMAGVPIVLNTLHGFYFHEHMKPAARKFYIQMEKIAARCSDVILSQNNEDIQTAISEGICSPEKIRYLGNGIDLSVFNPDRLPQSSLVQRRAAIGIPSDALVVGFVGRLAAKRKGFLDFLAAGQQIVQRLPNTRLLIIGDSDIGKPDAVSPGAAKEFGIEGHCIFLGQQPNSELPYLYPLMNTLVLPSLFEGVPRVIIEASAMRIPVVASDVKGNREAVFPNQNGLLVPWGNVQELGKAICHILEDTTLALQMGNTGRQIAMERFDEQQIFRKVTNEYDRLLQQKGLRLDKANKINNF